MRISVWSSLSLLLLSLNAAESFAQFHPGGRPRPARTEGAKARHAPRVIPKKSRDPALVLEEIRAALDRGESANAGTAIEQLRTVTVGDPTLTSRLDELAVEAARQERKLPELVAAFEKRRRQTSAFVRLLAGLELELGRTSQALHILGKAQRDIANDPQLGEAYCEALELSGDFPKSDRCYRSLLRVQPDREALLTEVFQRLWRRGKTDEAASVLREAEQRPDNTFEVSNAIADAWERLGERPHAADLLEKAMRATQPTEGHSRKAGQLSWLIDAEIAVENNNIEGAKSLIDLGLKSGSSSPDILVRAAKVYERAVVNSRTRDNQGYEKAVQLWLELLSAKSAREAVQTTAIEHLVRIWALQGTLQTQAQALERRLGNPPFELPLLLLLARVELRQSHDAQAEAWLAKALNLFPHPERILTELEQLSEKQGRYARALTYAEARLKISPNLPKSWKKLIEYAERLGNVAKARHYAEAFVNSEPKEPAAWAALARLARHNPAASLSHLATAYGLDRSRYDLLLELATQLHETGRKAIALSHALTLLRGDHDELRLGSAYRLAAPLARELGRVDELEQALYLAVDHNPQAKPLRTLLLALYETRLDAPTTAGQREVLPIAQRVARLLLEDLASPFEESQEAALRFLGRYPIGACAEALFQFARDNEQSDKGTTAFVILGKLKEGAILTPLLAWFKERKPHRLASPYGLAALYCLSQYPVKQVTSLLRDVLATGTPDCAAIAALSLAARKDRAGIVQLEPRLRLTQNATERAAILLAQEVLLPRSTDPSLLLTSTPSDVLRMTQIALLAERDARGFRADIAKKLCQGDLANVPLSLAAPQTKGAFHSALANSLKNPELVLEPERLIRQIVIRKSTTQERFVLFDELREDLGEACRVEIALQKDKARAHFASLFANDQELQLGFLLGEAGQLKDAQRAEHNRLTQQWLKSLRSSIERYRETPDVGLRSLALGLLSVGLEDEASVVSAMNDEAAPLRERALSWSRSFASGALLNAVAARLRNEELPYLRALSAERLGEATKLNLPPIGRQALSFAARRDPDASVRIAALKSLWRNNPVAAAAELSYAEATDTEVEVRVTSHKLLHSQP